ncbi:aromatic amino acid ammonia-lyase [Aspergillus candidus]|uniref:Phenylalanine ammonia-lyase n=1 Tax=Aspergillus candidus TaxID=41067 RepID=A0A2I2F8X6_ASPCN|nr:phenylalanine ammonia-lyase [Aspergillus candidus]PLB37058.1 phenylalanine ammonia-lyase [Aspergillus candidus]
MPTTAPPHLATALHTWYRLQEIKKNRDIQLDGNGLDIAAVVATAYYGCTPRLSNDPKVVQRITESVDVLMDHLDHGYCVYGVNTGFGGSADSRTDQATALQAALLQLTQAGVLVAADKEPERMDDLSPGPHSMPAAWVRGSIVTRVNSNARGHSAVSVSVLNGLLQLLHHRITPIVPLRGSVSASGDLIPLSYIAGTVEGSPDIYVQVEGPGGLRIMTAKDALATAGIAPRTMGPKEGLGLINGTAVSAAVASLALHETHQLALLVQALSAMGLEALTGTAEPFRPFVSATRPHDGQIECAANVLALLQGSQLAVGINNRPDRTRTGLVQDRYAWRSVPQWVGPQLEDLMLAHRQVSTELNSSSDNPLIDTTNGDIYSGANFQATSITSAMEKTRTALQMLGRLVFAQATELVDPNYNNGLPTNLIADDPCLSFTMKGVDISMAAYMAELAYVSHPVSAHTQTAEMRNQAINSLALVSARYTMHAVELASLLCAAYLYIICQALDLRALHQRFLAIVTGKVATVTREIIIDCTATTDEEASSVSAAVCATLASAWASTTRCDLSERCAQTAQAAVPVLCTAGACTSTLRVADVNAWQGRVATTLHETFNKVKGDFLTAPHTESLLGVGARALYRAVRIDLGVPFHQGFVEHPTADSTELDGRAKRTVGSRVSAIYESLRRGELQGGFMEVLGSL